MLKVPKYIKRKIERILKLTSEANELENELYKWLNDKKIDVETQEWEDGMETRICHAEFASADEFEEELNKYINGENVGYG